MTSNVATTNLTFQASAVRAVVRIVSQLLVAAFVLAGLVAGAVLGAVAGFVRGAGGKLPLAGGPGVWVAQDVRAFFKQFGPTRPLRAVPAALLGALAGLVTGPVWFPFMGYTGGRTAADMMADKVAA